jgi:hypothetical protein
MSVYDFGKRVIKAVDIAAEQGITVALQNTPYGAVDHLVYLGSNGGSLGNAAQIVVKGNKIVAFSSESYRKNPIKTADDVFVVDSNGNPKLSKNVYDPKSIKFDGRYEQTGAANFVTNSDYSDLNEKTTVRNGMVINDLRYLVGKGRRRQITDKNGHSTGFEVIDIPTADGYGKGGYMKVLDPRGIDLSHSLYGIGLGLGYKLADVLFFNPLVEMPVRKLKEHGERTKNKKLANISLDGFIEAEFDMISELYNDSLGLPKIREII